MINGAGIKDAGYASKNAVQGGKSNQSTATGSDPRSSINGIIDTMKTMTSSVKKSSMLTKNSVTYITSRLKVGVSI